MSVRALEASEKRTLAILGLPTAALALAITVVTTYVPVAASEFLDSSVVIGCHIALEGRARAVAAARRRQLVGPAQHVDRRPAAVSPRGHPPRVCSAYGEPA